MSRLQKIRISNYRINENLTANFDLSFQLFGRPLDAAPVVLVNHALTGNSLVAGPNGWWRGIVGKHKLIDLTRYAVIAFDIPGNGFGEDPVSLPVEIKQMNTKLIAKLYWKALCKLGVKKLFAVIGGSLGGSIGWEMVFQNPRLVEHLIPVACSPKASDWLVGNVMVQAELLKLSENPVETARKHAMLLYRTPQSFELKFGNRFEKDENQFAVESWLNYHGKSLKDRFSLESYQLMNHLLKTIGQDLTDDEIISFSKMSSTQIHLIAVDSDYMFTRDEQLKLYRLIRRNKYDISFQEIKSVHGHDAFLIENEQLNSILEKVFRKSTKKRAFTFSRTIVA